MRRVKSCLRVGIPVDDGTLGNAELHIVEVVTGSRIAAYDGERDDVFTFGKMYRSEFDRYERDPIALARFEPRDFGFEFLFLSAHGTFAYIREFMSGNTLATGHIQRNVAFF